MSWKCENCKWENADKWANCAKCGKPSGLPPKIVTREDKIFKYLAISLLVIFFIIVFILFDTLKIYIPAQPTDIDAPYKTMQAKVEEKENLGSESFAYIACLGFLEKHYNVSSISDFASRDDSLVIEESENIFQVHTKLYSSTSFGSTIEQAVYCRVIYFPESEKWGLSEISN